MNAETKEAILHWWRSHLASHENPAALLEARKKDPQKAAEASRVAAEKMKESMRADEVLYALKGDLPEPLRKHLEANADKGCIGCWFSSNPVKLHAECGEKITRWFDTQKELKLFADQLSRPSDVMTSEQVGIAVAAVCDCLQKMPDSDTETLITLLCYTEGLGNVHFDNLPVVADYAQKLWKALQ